MIDTATQTPDAEELHDDVRAEPDALPRGLALRTLLATVVIGASLCFATYFILRVRVREVRPSYEFPEHTMPAPHEVSGVREELFAAPHARPSLPAQQRAELDSFGWVDRARRVVHIPIERAIDLAAARARRGETP